MLTQKDLQSIGTLIKTEGDRFNQKIDAQGEQLDRKIETVLSLTKQAHAEIMEALFKSNEVNGHEIKALEKRVGRLEEHTGLTKPS